MKKWYLSYDQAVKDCPQNGTIHCLPGVSRFEDYYVIALDHEKIIRKCSMTFSKKHSKFWNACHLMIGNKCILFCSLHRAQKIIARNIPVTDEVIEYLQGHRTPQEFWNKKINKTMEAARTSHAICDMQGTEGHQARQNIRRKLLNM